MLKPRIDNIFLDLDGVVFDFSKRYKELYRMEPHEADKAKQFKPFFLDFIASKQFESLDLMEDAMMGIEHLRTLDIPVTILTSTARKEFHEEITKQKLVCLEKHGIEFTPIFVPGKRLKKDYSDPHSIIIDDTLSVIEQFRSNGGYAIHHKSWDATLIDLHHLTVV